MSRHQRRYDVKSFDPTEDDPDEWALEHRDEIARAAESDADDAWVFERILAHIDEEVSSS